MLRLSRFCFLGCSAIAFVCTGCTHNGKPVAWAYPHAAAETLTESPAEHYNRVTSILEFDRRALVDDLDLVFMTDRPSRLSRWHSR